MVDRRGAGTRAALRVAGLVLVLAGLSPGAAHAAFPYAAQGAPTAYEQFRIPSGANKTPKDLVGKLAWMYAATPAGPVVPDKRELDGVRGAHLADAADVDQAWRTTTGRPDVTIGVTDSGIEWDDLASMRELRFKTRLSRGELGGGLKPRADRSTASEPGQACGSYTGTGLDGFDRNSDGVFNVLDYACDARVNPEPANGVGPTFTEADGPDFAGKPMLDPQDVLIALSDGKDSDANGYVDDIVGWDFLDDDNDPFDDVGYGHGTNEAKDSVAEADNGGELGTCPNCMVSHLRVGTSFVADVNRFGLAVTYATDNDISVVQDALGALNKSALARDAIDYAWEHGVTVIASAADEAAQHNNWPSSYPRVILVNSVTHSSQADAAPGNARQSYLQFNGCTNFNAKVDLSIPSVACSSDATGRGAGMAALIYSAAKNAKQAGHLDAHPTCKRTDGSACLLSSAEIKQIMASGSIGGVSQADDVNFAQDPLSGASTELTCPAPGCTDPFAAAPTTREANTVPRSYPARKGHDQFYGYGRVNMNRVVDAIVPDGDAASKLPPEVEVTSPEWYGFVDPTKATATVKGRVWARGEKYTCRVLVAPGGYPNNAEAPAGDFAPVESDACDGTTPRSMPIDGDIARIDTAALKARYPAGTAGDFRGPEHGLAGEQPYSGRPNSETYAFVVKVVADRVGPEKLRGEDRRKLFLHRDQEVLEGFPRELPGDGEASPLLVDLDGDNRNELVVANSDGVVHAFRREGSELPGFPVHGDELPHQPGRAFSSGGIRKAYGAMIATPAVGDLDHDGTPEIVAADLEGKIYVWDATGKRVRTMTSNPAYAGIPVKPFVNTRVGLTNRTQLGFLGSPVLADLDRDDGGRLEVVAAALDRHVYAFEDDGKPVPGYPVLTVDRAKVASIDPVTHRVAFKSDAGAAYDQGAIVDTPAVGDIAGDPRPEIVVGTNESYAEPLNAGGLNEAVYAPLGAALVQANGRVFAIKPEGEPGGPKLDSNPWVEGWPFKIGILQAGILPLVGEGVTGNPVIGVTPCRSDLEKVRVGLMPAAGVPYLVNPDGQSCLGRTSGKDEGLPTEGGSGTDQPFLAAFGHPAFAALSGGTSFLVPAAGLNRAVDVVLPEYQGGQDYLVSYSTRTGRIDAGWPRPVNDLQFLTGPSVGDIDPTLPGEEILAASASMDLQAFTAGGTDVPGWPKLTGDWTVTNPTLGSFGTLDTDAAARRDVVSLTRSGRILAYATKAPACAAASWPRFHHDNANSGDARRDAVLPGTPSDAALVGGKLEFVAPGDDGLCGKAKGYEVRTSDAPITAETFERATPVAGTFAPGAPGSRESLALPGGLRKVVAVRAVDEQGNVGRPAVVGEAAAPTADDGRGDGSSSPTAVPGGGPTTAAGDGRGDGGRPPAAGNGVSAAASKAAGGAASRCLPRAARFDRRGLRVRGGPFLVGDRLTTLVRRAGKPTRKRKGGVRRWCVQGGGHVTVLVRRGRVALVASTAVGHRAGTLHRGLKLASVRKRNRGLRSIGRGVRVLSRTSSVAFALRNGRVRYVAVSSRALRRTSRTLTSALRTARL